MVVVEVKKDLVYYMDARLKKNLDNIKKTISQKDMDYVLCVDGYERSGKSTLAQQIGSYISPEMGLPQICMSGQEFIKAIQTAKKFSCIIYDEAYAGLSSRGSLSEINNLIVSLMTEMGSRNLFVIIVVPSFFLLDRYVSIWRTRSVIHTYLHKGKRGQWKCYTRDKKNLLYLKGKKDYNYKLVKPSFKGRFTGKYTVDEKKYRDKKDKALKDRSRVTKSEKFKDQRDLLIGYLHNDMGLKVDVIVKECRKTGIDLKRTQIFDILKSIKENKEIEPEDNINKQDNEET